MAPVELPLGTQGHFYACAMPFSIYDREKRLLQDLLDHQVSLVVMLVTDEEARGATGTELRRLYQDRGLEVLQAPIADMQVPERAVLEGALAEASHALGEGKNVAVHCHAGRGRTGLFAACLAKELLDLDGAQAVGRVRQYIPGAVETEAQEQFVFTF